MVNNKVVWKKGKMKNKVSGLQFDKSDEAYISFKVKGGTWNFRAIKSKE